MAFVLYVENDMNLHLDELRLEEDQTPIVDAVIKAHFGEVADPVPTITGASNASPIVITSPAHGLSNGDFVLVSQVRGNPAANGYFEVAGVTTNTFNLVGSTGDGTYYGGGVWYRAVAGAVNIDLDYVPGTPCSYLGQLGRANNVVQGRQYVVLVECTNYGVKFEARGVSRVRT